MDEKPKSIWKKSWTGWRGLLLGWLMLTIALIAIFLIWLMTMGRPVAKAGEEIQLLGIGWIAVTVIFLLAAFIRWLCCWRNLKRSLFALACLATLVALFYAEENWRGKRAWNSYVRECEAAGESMDWNAYVPRLIPDDQNLAMCPLLKPILDYTQTNNLPNGNHTIWNDTNGTMRVYRLSARWNNGWVADKNFEANHRAQQALDENPMTNGFVNMLAWQNYFRTGTNLDGVATNKTPVQDVLLALRFMEPDLAELQTEAARRPLTRWPVHYETVFKAGILLPHLGNIREIVRTLQLRSAARLAAGDVVGSLADVELGLRLASSVENEPFLITLLVRGISTEDMMQPLREGIMRHQFSEAQLAAVQQQLAALDFFKAFKRASLTERTMHAGWDKLSSSVVDDLFRGMSMKGETFAETKWLLKYAPKGWVYRNQIALCRVGDELISRVLDVLSHQARPKQVKSPDQLTDELPRLFTILARLRFSFNFFGQASWNTARHQSIIEQTVVACALERYRLAHGEFPESLDALAPQFLEKIPHDVIGGQPLKYRRTADGQFVLYSIGWNEKDDGGVVVFKRDSSTEVDINQGDWVWRYPAK